MAKEFKVRMDESSFLEYKVACKSEHFKDGTWCMFKYDKKIDHLVVFFPTKHDWKNRSDPVLIESALKSLADWLEYEDIPSCAIPPLGCGLGKLDWVSDVLPMVRKYLGPIKTKITVVY